MLWSIQWKTLNTPRQKNPFYCKQIWRSLDGMCCGPGAPFICVVIYLFTISPASISWLHPWDRGRGKKPPNYLPIFAPSAAPFSYLCPKSCNMTLYVFFVYSCLHILDVSSLREFLSKFNAWMNKWIRGKTLKEEKRLPNGQMNMSKKGGIWSLRVLVFKTDRSVILKLVVGPRCNSAVSRVLPPHNSLSAGVGRQHCNDAGLEAHWRSFWRCLLGAQARGDWQRLGGCL